MKTILFLVIVAVLVSGCVIGDGDRDYAMSHITPTDAQSSLMAPVITTPAATPYCDYTENISTGVAPLTVQFSDPCPRSPLTTRRWGFGDGNSSDQQNPVHTYTSPGIYEVTFTIDNGLGSISTEMSNFKRIFVLDHPISTPNYSALNQPSGYWIRIDPISDKPEGDIFTVNASTNLSVGEEILVQIYREGRYPKSQSGEFAGGYGIVKVVAEKDGNNSISFMVNSSEFHLTSATYSFHEDAVNENASGWAQFNIWPRDTR